MLELKDLYFHYQSSNELFEGLSINFGETGLYGISGANGSGKTTLLKIIAGLIIPKQGNINYQNSKLRIEDTSYLDAKESSFFYQMTGAEGLELFCKLNHINLRESAARHFLDNDLVKEIRASQFHQMSHGMKRLFLLILTFTKPAKVYLLDEPFVGMDKERRDFTYQNLNILAKYYPILVSSHYENDNLSFDGKFKLGA